MQTVSFALTVSKQMDNGTQPGLEARNEAFRRLGRNVYLFQLIERQLKHLVVHASIQGHVDELPKNLAARSKKARKASLGELTEQFVADVYRRDADIGIEPSDLSKAWYSFAFKIESEAEFVRERQKELRRLVRERNKLIHTAAADIRPADTDKWIEFGEFLDRQRQQLVLEHETFRLMIRDLFELTKQAAQSLECEIQTSVPLPTDAQR